MNANEARWQRLRAHLDDLGAADLDNSAGRVGAVLALLVERDRDLEFVLTRRREDLPTHPGQVSFPGGRREEWEVTETAALREAAEEVSLRPDTVEIIGQLPAFFIGPSRYWMVPVVGRWLEPHPLRAQESEVAEIVRASVSQLMDRARWRKVRLSVTGWSWAWALDDGHVLWGATGMVVTMLLDVIEPEWRRGLRPADLSDDAEVMPWLDPRLRGRAMPARLSGTPSRSRGQVGPPEPADRARTPVAGAAIERAAGRLDPVPRSVVVLVGSGGTGAVGLVAARRLTRVGLRVTAVTATGGVVEGVPSEAFGGDLPRADLYIDALVGSGLHGGLRGVPLEMLLALRRHPSPILAVDLPSGLHPTEGLIGDLVPATVTVALGGVWPALTAVGLSPFVGDLYLWEPGSDDVVRLGAGREGPPHDGGWRE